MKIFKTLNRIFFPINDAGDKCNHIYIDRYIINDIGYVHLICKKCQTKLRVTFLDYRKLRDKNKVDEEDEKYLNSLLDLTHRRISYGE